MIFSPLFFVGSAEASGNDDVTWVPEQFQGLVDNLGFGGVGLADFFTSRISQLLGYAAIALVVVAIVYIFITVYNYISSNGDQQQIETAAESAQHILRGFAFLFVAFAGMILIFVFFGIPFIPTEAYQVCIVGPNSHGCRACQADGGGLPDDFDSNQPIILNTSSNYVPTAILATSLASFANGDGEAGVRFSSPALGTSTELSFVSAICTFCEYEYYHKAQTDRFISPDSTVRAYCEDL